MLFESLVWVAVAGTFLLLEEVLREEHHYNYMIVLKVGLGSAAGTFCFSVGVQNEYQVMASHDSYYEFAKSES